MSGSFGPCRINGDVMKRISREENPRVITALSQFQPIGEVERRVVELSIRFLQENSGRAVDLVELSEYVEDNAYEGPDEERVVVLIAFAVGVGIGYAAGSLVESMIDSV